MNKIEKKMKNVKCSLLDESVHNNNIKRKKKPAMFRHFLLC